MKELKPKHSSPVMERGRSAQRSRERRDRAWLTFHLQNKDINGAIIKFFVKMRMILMHVKALEQWLAPNKY